MRRWGGVHVCGCRGGGANARCTPFQPQNGNPPPQTRHHKHRATVPSDGTTDPFATEQLIEELTDTTDLGGRGEGFFVAQVVAVLAILFPPAVLGVSPAPPAAGPHAA